MNQDDSERHKRSARLYEEAGAKQAVSVAVPEVHHGRKANHGDENVMEDDERTLG